MGPETFASKDMILHKAWEPLLLLLFPCIPAMFLTLDYIQTLNLSFSIIAHCKKQWFPTYYTDKTVEGTVVHYVVTIVLVHQCKGHSNSQ